MKQGVQACPERILLLFLQVRGKTLIFCFKKHRLIRYSNLNENTGWPHTNSEI